MILERKKSTLKSGHVNIVEESHDIMSILRECVMCPSKFTKAFTWILARTVKANTEANEQDRLSEDQLLGQMKSVDVLLSNCLYLLRAWIHSTLILAGHETTRCVYVTSDFSSSWI
jgi:hypothetical protein